MTGNSPSRIIVGITGATGAIFGVRLLEALQRTGVETHLIVSKWGAHTLAEETSYSLDHVRQVGRLLLCPQRSRRAGFKRLLSHRWHGDRAVQHAHAWLPSRPAKVST